MKYPLKLIEINDRPWKAAVIDNDRAVILQVMNIDRAMDLAEAFVGFANRWHNLRVWFRPYTREDWLWERNTWKG